MNQIKRHMNIIPVQIIYKPSLVTYLEIDKREFLYIQYINKSHLFYLHQYSKHTDHKQERHLPGQSGPNWKFTTISLESITDSLVHIPNS